MRYAYLVIAALFIAIPSARGDANTSEADVVDTYAEARRLEAEIVEMYREIRAAELSVVQRQTYDRSLESTLIPLSDRAEVDEDLLRRAVEDAEDLESYQRELGVVVQETDAIVANARSLLEQFETEPTGTTRAPEEKQPEEQQEQEPEEKESTEPAEREEEEKPEKPEEEKKESSEEKEKQEKAKKEKEEELKKEVEEEIAKTEVHLEKALKEIREAREKVKTETKEVESEIAEAREKAEETAEKPEKAEQEKQEKEKKAKTEKLEKLKELEQQVDAAEKAVEEVAKGVGELKEPSKEQTEKAEAALTKLREAMAKVIKADQTASESTGEVAKEESEQEAGAESEKIASEESETKAKENTEKAVQEMKKAGESLASARDKISELESLADSDGDGSDSDSDGDNSGEGENMSEELAIARQQALAQLAKSSSGKWLDITDQMRGLKLEEKPVPPPAAALPDLWKDAEELENAPSIRKVLNTSAQTDQWLFVGDWYVLNRYDNKGRANIQKVYPPESILDLNAHYLSEDGKPMKWEYESYAPPRMTPYGWEEWKIYYFYTEIYFDEETEAWFAIGSDDRSDLWINDLPVWHSANQHKGLDPGEGFRKVVFKKGHNKVLLRLENGHGGAAVSLFLNLQSP